MIFHSSMYYTAPKYLLMNLVPVALLLFRLLESKHKDLIRYTGPIIIVSFMLGMLLSFSDYARAYIDTYKTVETLENLSNKYHQNVWISDENRGEFYYIPNKFNICSNDKVVHEFQAGDLILGTPWFYKDDIYAKGLIAKPLEGIFYTIPIFTMVDPFNQVFFDFGGFGRYLPYTLSTENNPTFILYKLAREDKPENAE